MTARPDHWLIMLALSLLATFPGQLFGQCPDGSPPPCPGPPPRSTAAPPANTVAVLYLDNLSRDSADAYLADGLTEEITARLGLVERLAVKSRNAVRRYRGPAAGEPVVVGRALGVAHLVSGSLRRSGNHLRVSVELVRAASGLRIWGAQYDRMDADLLAIEEEVASAVATAVAGRLLPRERASLAVRPTANREAYDHFLRGNYYLARRIPRAVATAIEEYQAAARLDPAFTAALARAAYGYALYLDWGWAYPGVPPETLLARGWAAASRVLAVDTAATDAWMARAYLLAYQAPRTLAGAREAFERAIALDPKNAEAWHQYGWILAIQGDDTDALAAFRRALAIDPERAVTWLHIGAVAVAGRHYAEATQWLDSAIAVDPWFHLAYAYRAFARLGLGDATSALADARTAIRLGGEDPLWGEAALTIAQARLGDTVAARARAESLATTVLRADAVGVDVGWVVAATLVAIGERDRALDALERIRPRGAHFWFDVKVPQLDPIRSDPRFQRLVAESRPPPAPRQ